MLAFYLLLLCGLSTAEDSSKLLQGAWKASGYYYEGQLTEPDDPQLNLVFDFYADGTHRLFWQRKDELKFCELKGTWSVKGDQLFNQVTWLNPQNASECSSDPDMQLNKKSQSKIEFKDGKIFVEIPFSDSVIIYVWERIEKESKGLANIIAKT